MTEGSCNTEKGKTHKNLQNNVNKLDKITQMIKSQSTICKKWSRCTPSCMFKTSNANWCHMEVTQTHTHPFNGPFLGLPRWAGTRKVKPIRILLKQEAVSGSGISWAICKSAPRSRQMTTTAPHHSVFYRPDAFLPPNQQRQSTWKSLKYKLFPTTYK